MKLNKLLTGICLLTAFAACDNYLDITPKGEAVLNTTDDYLGLLEEEMPTYTGSEFGYLANVVTYYDRSQLDGYSFPLISSSYFWDESVDRAQYMDDDAGESQLYNNCYARISRYNIIIDNIGDAEGPASDKRLATAQAKVMRAYNYFWLVNTFAKPYDPETAETDRGIIIHTEFDLEAESTQGTVADAYALICRDIDEAIPDLPEQALNTYRPDKAFGYAFKAKVMLYMRQYTDALEAALEALKHGNHRLWDMPAWLQETADNSFGAGTDLSQDWIYGMVLMNGMHGHDDPENLLYQPMNAVFNATMLNKATADLYDKQRDVRYRGVFSWNMAQRPTAEEGSVAFMYGTNIKLNEAGMRLSEVYLIIAECYARQGDRTLTADYLNALREKRLLDYVPLTADDLGNNADSALRFVREERRRELVTSCNDFFDMRRFAAELGETLTKTYVDSQGTTHTFTLAPDSHLLTFPFPLRAMQTSALTQNSK